MAILDIVKWPDQLLTKVSTPVDKIDKNLQKFMDDMLETMHKEQGIGLAAVQVGVLKRILIMDISENERYPDLEKATGPEFFINPELIKHSAEKTIFKEGCLSFPGVFADVKRYADITVKYLDYNGKEQSKEMSGINAICFQHELDHLNGITFIDHLSRLKREKIIKKYFKQAHA